MESEISFKYETFEEIIANIERQLAIIGSSGNPSPDQRESEARVTNRRQLNRRASIIQDKVKIPIAKRHTVGH